jgi:hypothetical protein
MSAMRAQSGALLGAAPPLPPCWLRARRVERGMD